MLVCEARPERIPRMSFIGGHLNYCSLPTAKPSGGVYFRFLPVGCLREKQIHISMNHENNSASINRFLVVKTRGLQT
jgi:hypothetical protein